MKAEGKAQEPHISCIILKVLEIPHALEFSNCVQEPQISCTVLKVPEIPHALQYLCTRTSHFMYCSKGAGNPTCPGVQ